ncbi:MAG TPA: hypothetical protein PLH11_12170, partial [Gemmobacter sp.]|nr:hypothetical protein [Gemmobacter sp.]
MKSWIKAFSLRAESLLSTKARSATDLMAKLRVWNNEVICLHSFINLVFSVIDFHLLYIFFCP